MKLPNSNIKEALSLLPKETPKKLLFLLIFQIMISTLDIFAILLLGIVSKSGLDYMQDKVTAFPEIVVTFLGIRGHDYTSQAAIISIIVVSLFILRTTISIYGNKRIFLYLANQASFASREIVKRMFKSKPQSIINRDSQEFLYGITQGIDNLTLNFLGSSIIFVAEIVFLSSMVIVVFAIHPLTGVMAFFIFALATLSIHKLTSEKTKQFASEYANLNVFYNKRFLDTLLVYRELVLRQTEVNVANEIQVARSKSLKLRAQLIFLPTLSKYLFELVLVLGGSIIAVVQLAITDTLTAISSVAVFLAAASRILPSLIRAQGALLSIRQSEGSAEITINQLSELALQFTDRKPIEIQENVSTVFEPILKITNVNFSYEKDAFFALEDINLEVKPGQFVAIVGESGSGKTTLVDLILGMLTPTSGSITISGISPLDAIQKWPGKIAYVPQDVAIIDGDIKRNVILEENPKQNENEILMALDKAHLKNEILKMPLGVNEIVGERGIRLSGGQRQRLGIARALYTKPEIIIFDEATSSLDPITEKAVTDSIYGRSGDITLIVVAHRLSTVKNADLVILIEKGKILAKGTFEEVRSISPKFDQQAKLVNL